MKRHLTLAAILCIGLSGPLYSKGKTQSEKSGYARQRVSFNEDWRFMKYESADAADSLIYDVRPAFSDDEDGKAADAKPTEAVAVEAHQSVLKPWILPTANPFIADPADRYQRPEGDPGSDFDFVQSDFDDSAWESVDLPHDWAIEGPFYEGPNAPVGGGMGRLPSPGVAWYRKEFEVPGSDQGKRVSLDIEGAMSYAMVWCNGHIVGGWPYGYASWSVELTPYLNFGGKNHIAIRLDNPPASSRWYPGGGIYRDVWLRKTNPVHVGQWGTYITTPSVSDAAADVELAIDLVNDSATEVSVTAETEIYVVGKNGAREGDAVARFPVQNATLSSGEKRALKSAVKIESPRLWGPPPNQDPNLYLAVTTLRKGDELVDRYETRFGIRELRFDAKEGLYVNGERIYFKGVNQHHDLGALGAAFNRRAAERQLEMLRELGCNAIRLAHNPPGPQSA